MKSNQQQMIAAMIKEGRIAKGYTQKELAELSNISIRSIQRIENAQLQPRSYTLKLLSAVLDVPFDKLSDAAITGEPGIPNVSNKAQKIIISTGIGILFMLLYAAFIAQSNFPETTFEFLMGTVVLMVAFIPILCYIWRTKRS